MLARQIVVGLGIAAIFRWVIYYGLSTFYSPPRIHYYGIGAASAAPPTATAEERRTYAEEQQKKRKSFETAAREFARVLFTVSTVLGVAAILIGAYLNSHAVGAGLILGGIFSLALGYSGYAHHLDRFDLPHCLLGLSLFSLSVIDTFPGPDRVGAHAGQDQRAGRGDIGVGQKMQ